MATFNYSGTIYHSLDTPLGTLWIHPTDGKHIYADASHNSLGSGPVRPEGDRCEPLTVNGVKYGTSVHFYKWDDGVWHIGPQYVYDYQAKRYTTTLQSEYERKQSVHMSKQNAKNYNDSHPSQAAVTKVLNTLPAILNKWVAEHGDVLIEAEKQAKQEEIEKLNREITEALGEIENKKAEVARLREAVAVLAGAQ